jgi:hypothetical protein
MNDADEEHDDVLRVEWNSKREKSSNIIEIE